MKRYTQYDNLEKNGDPKVMWLPDLHIRSYYLKDIIRVTCKKKQWPLEKTDIYTIVTKYMSPDEVKDKPQVLNRLVAKVGKLLGLYFEELRQSKLLYSFLFLSLDFY